MSLVASVVVPTFNRAERLPRLLAALQAQDAGGPHEIVIVDDCSTDDTWTVLQKLAAEAEVSVRTLRTPQNSGPATGRNIGWRAANGPVVVFTDDDCVPQPGWLGALVSALDDADVVQGQTIPAPGSLDAPFARTMMIEEWSDLFETCNMAYRRELLERVSGFDETFRRPYGEDADLGWRALAAGATARYEHDAVVFHDVEHETHLRDFVAELRGHARKMWAVRAVKLHPALRRRFYRHWFFGPAHPRTLTGLLTTAAAFGRYRGSRRALLTAAGWVPYLHYVVVVRRRAAKGRSVVPVLALGLVSDVGELTAMVIGSARFRTLLL